MGKPRMIILIRHAQSEGNKNHEIHQTVPDHRVKLTPEGHRQAHEAGTRLRELLRPDDTLHFFTSPYRRTRETTEGLLNSLTTDTPVPSPFPRHTITVYEEPRLREQDFGNFQPCSAEMERMWLERADYGHFFYRIPNGESAADAYDRVSGFNESLWRLFGENDFASVCVLVTHGLMTRVFLMKWYHWSVEYFEDLRNINHCEFVTMKLNPDNGKYTLQNNMRTWSELKREKELEGQRERAAKGLGPATPAAEGSNGSISIRRRWGGCPEGCDHGVRRRTSVRNARGNGIDTARQHDHYDTKKTTPTDTNTNDITKGMEQLKTTGGDNPSLSKLGIINATTPDDHEHHIPIDSLARSDLSSLGHPTTNTKPSATTNQLLTTTPPTNTLPSTKRPHLSKVQRDSSEDHLLHPPNLALLHLVGRDGGGSMSGMNSLAPSEDEREDHPTTRRPGPRTAAIGSHQPRPSHDIGNDGDDEGSEAQAPPPRLRRARSHNQHHHHRSHHPQLHHALSRRQLASRLSDCDYDYYGRDGTDADADDTDHPAAGDGDADRETSAEVERGVEGKPEVGEYEPIPAHRLDDETGDTLEAERQQDQSVRGSVY